MSGSPSGTMRIYYVHPLLVGRLLADGKTVSAAWEDQLSRCRDLGFDHVLLAPPFACRAGEGLFLTQDHGRLHPQLGGGSAADGLAALSDACARQGLGLLLDLVVDRVGGGHELARYGTGGREASLPDPRQTPEERAAVRLTWQDPAVRAELTAWWRARLCDWATAGVGGFCCRRPDALAPADWAQLIPAAREARPDLRFLAWTPGLTARAVEALPSAGFDGAFSSLPWWTPDDEWLVPEWDRLRSFGAVIASPEEPFGSRLRSRLSDGALVAAAYRRALGLASTVGSGLMIPMGFEYATREPLERDRGAPGDLGWLRERAPVDLSDDIAAANRRLADDRVLQSVGELRPLTAPGGRIGAWLRVAEADARLADEARLILVNHDLHGPASVPADAVLPGMSGWFAPEAAEPDEEGFVLAPGQVEVVACVREPQVAAPADQQGYSVKSASRAPRLILEALSPQVSQGRHPVKRTVGERVTVEVDAFTDGHEKIAVALLWRPFDEAEWRERRMQPLGNDRWTGSFPLERLGRHLYTVETWKDEFATFRDELAKKHRAGLGVALEVQEGIDLVASHAKGAAGKAAKAAERLLDALRKAGEGDRIALLLSDEAAAVMAAADPRPFRLRHEPFVLVDAERMAARFSSWYEIFPRSQSGDPARHGTFDDVIAALPRVKAMGFDALYFPPIHPIGRKNRKGRNNSLVAGSDDPGSPYAIGSEAGGHDAIHPELGTFEDFARLRDAAFRHGLELVLDFAIQCAPDHPWLKQHPDWFSWRPDGSIRYAENPPKKYEDIVNVDFYAKGAIPDLWVALRDIVLFWVEQGVRVFRVDNPHTKPFPFWEWLIADVRGRHPDTIFLAEAFTRPKVMNRLAKIGFSQSYTYFTWRTGKAELRQYMEELTQSEAKDFFRPHFFVNTPDINPVFLQRSGRPGFLIRAALAATLSGLWGVYNGFDLCEADPVPGKEEYLNSEKYEIKAWDYDRPGNIVGEITRLNQIRRWNPALQTHLGVTFHDAWNDQILWYEKATPTRDNVVLVAVNLDPHHAQEAAVEVPLWKWGLPDDGALAVHDLMSGHRFVWQGKHQNLRLDPAALPFGIWRVKPLGT